MSTVADGSYRARLLGLLGIGVLSYLTYLKLFRDEAIWGRPLLLLGMLFALFGLILVCVGLLAEMLVRIYHESQGKPTYVVKEISPAAEPEKGRVAPGR